MRQNILGETQDAMLNGSISFIKPSKDDPWTMYILLECPYCHKAISFFKERGFDIIYHNNSSVKNQQHKQYVIIYIVHNDKKKEFMEEINYMGGQIS